MRFHLGSRGSKKQERPTIRFSDWIAKAPAGEYPVVLIFLPDKYPSYTFSWDVPEGRVRMSVAGQKGREMLRQFGFKKTDLEFSLKFVLDNEAYGFDTDEGYLYWRGWGWSVFPSKGQEFDIEL